MEDNHKSGCGRKQQRFIHHRKQLATTKESYQTEMTIKSNNAAVVADLQCRREN